MIYDSIPHNLVGNSWKSEPSRGAKLLDEKFPGWYRSVDPETVDIRRLTDCPLGQMAMSMMGDFDEAWTLRSEIFPQVTDDLNWCTHGFHDPENHKRCNKEWRELIIERRNRDLE